MALTKITKTGITDAAVEKAKIGADAVDATKIADDAISEEHLDVTAITGHTELAAASANDDVVLIFDTSASAIKKIQRSNLTLQAPTFSSISPSNANTGDGTGNHTFTVTGTKFDSSPVVKFRGNDGSALISSTSTTRNSESQLTVVIAKSSLPNSNEPYDVSITNTNGLAIESTSNPLNINAQPAFNTSAGTLGTKTGGTNVGRIIIDADDPESSGVVTYELQSGSLPAGLSLTNETSEGGIGVISGTATNPTANTTSNFVIRAVDAQSNTTSRAFSITVNRVFTSTSFTSSGTFAVPSGMTVLSQVLVVAGGASGSGDNGGGGGAGGLILMPCHPVTPGGTLTVTVGCGGAASPCNCAGNAGSDTTFGSPGDPGLNPGGLVLTAKGGGRGGKSTGTPNNAQPGGSGGGGGGHGDNQAGGTGIQPTQPGNSGAYGFGNPGGNSNPGTSPRNSGGGGGAGAAGSAGGNYSGQGGDGKSYTIADGTTGVFYAGGGGGGSNQPNTSGQGGQGGGGGGASPSGASGSGTTSGGAGTANKGGGGGGGSNSNPRTGGVGGKGIVVVRF